MIRDLLESRKKVLSITNIVQMLVTIVVFLLFIALGIGLLTFVSVTLSNGIARRIVATLIPVAFGLGFIMFTVIARLITMLNIDYDRVATPLEVIRSHCTMKVLQISLIYFIINAIKIGFYTLVIPIMTEDLFIRELISEGVAFLLIKFMFTIQLMLEYKKLDFITALGKSWDILKGSKLISVILLRISTIPIIVLECYLISKLFSVAAINVFGGIGIGVGILAIILYRLYLETFYYYNLSKEETSEFGPYR